MVAPADYQQMEQVFIKVIKNALEAVNPKGKIRIKSLVNQKAISISNTGAGIPKEVSGQLFSPFFSTKKNGQGIGFNNISRISLHVFFGK